MEKEKTKSDLDFIEELTGERPKTSEEAIEIYNKYEKGQKRGYIISRIIDYVLLTILIIAVVIAQINGKYIQKEIIQVETCNGVPTPEGIKTLEGLGWNVTKEETKTKSKEQIQVGEMWNGQKEN